MSSWVLVVLNGPSGDFIPDLPVTTFGCNGNFLRRRIDHVVCMDLKRLKLARQHHRSVYTRPRWCRSGDHAVPDQAQTFNDSGNAAIWAAHLMSPRVVIVGADAWMGGATRTVCDELYEVLPKKDKLGPIWRRRFVQWSSQTTTSFEFVWHEPQQDLQTITLSQFRDKYTVDSGLYHVLH